MTSTTGDRIHTSGDHIESLPDDIPDYHTAALPDVKYTSQSSVKDEFTSGAGSTGFYHDMRESVASSVGGDITGGWVQSNASLTQGPPVAPTPRSDAQSKTVRPLESSLPSRPRTALRFIVRPYDSQTFKGFEVEGGGNVPNKTASRPATGTKQRGVGVGAVAPGKKRGIASKSEMALTKGAVETKAEGKYPPRHHHHSLHHLPLSPTPTLPSRFHCRTHPAPYPHPIALPPLRTRTGLLGISNRNTPHSAYEDRLRAWGLTRAGCSSDERVLCVPGENGDSRHRLRT
ncbi:hypothetical protein DFS34DRAFT_494201 [Phlyctochytrium arcticum]|nr:hypothetical protein DFS34DRAFT_494201 [Phlyctochytrium arcticum]